MAVEGRLLEVAAGWSLRYLVGRAMSRKPTIYFDPPRQGAGFGPGDPLNISWWHIPITLRYRWPWQSDHIERCRVFLISSDKDEGVYMRWQSPDSATGVSEVTLEQGRIRLVPVVRRDESGDGSALITNESYLTTGTPKWIIPAGSRIRIRLEVQYGKQKQRCEQHFYNIIVPPKGIGNGFFTMEMRYPERD